MDVGAGTGPPRESPGWNRQPSFRPAQARHHRGRSGRRGEYAGRGARGQYSYLSRSGAIGGDYYAWYRDLPAEFHDNLTRFSNRTDRDMCVAYWDRGTLYSMQTVPPGQATTDSYLPDAIVDCRYCLA